MRRRDDRRSLSVPLRLITDGRLEWTATVPASMLSGGDTPAPLRIADVEVPPDSTVDVALVLERISGGLSVAGEITGGWTGPCARCWIPLDGNVSTTVREVFSTEPRDGEQYLLGAERADLGPMVREAMLLALPIEAVPCPHPEPCPNLPPELDRARSDHDAGGPAASADPYWQALESVRALLDEPS